MEKQSRKLWAVLLVIFTLILVVGTFAHTLPFQDIGGMVDSRRDILNIPTLIVMGAFVVINLWWLKKATKKVRKRAAYTLGSMIFFAGIWTWAQVIANNRWIEVGTVEVLTKAPPLIEFLALSYDVVIEIGAAYLAFLAIAYLLKLIK